MKLLLLTLLISSTALAKDDWIKKRYYFTALNDLLTKTNGELSDRNKQYFEKLLTMTGIEVLEDYNPKLLEKVGTESAYFILGKKFFGVDDSKSQHYLSQLESSHRYYPESQLVLSQIFANKGDYNKTTLHLLACQTSSQINRDQQKLERIKRYYQMIYELCVVNKSRYEFGEGKFQEALKGYNKVPKSSYMWPSLILEKAWVYYHLKDYNRSLGLLITYKSPLLDSYFYPEAEYLTSLNYFQLCLWEDTYTVIKQYYDVYRPHFSQLGSVFGAQRLSSDYFYNIMFRPTAEKPVDEEFVKKIIVRLKKQVRFSLDFNTIRRLDTEMNVITKNESSAVQKKLLVHLKQVKDNLVQKINYHAKEDIFKTLEKVQYFSGEMFKINLEIISKKKDLIYSNKKLIADRGRGDLGQVQRAKTESFWTFDGPFWADELGDYSFGLKSNCETVRRQGEE
ncbi:MAG: hypothetical protein ACOVP4_03425 [Bacteriovoracaceae bacterium]